MSLHDQIPQTIGVSQASSGRSAIVRRTVWWPYLRISAAFIQLLLSSAHAPDPSPFCPLCVAFCSAAAKPGSDRSIIASLAVNEMRI